MESALGVQVNVVRLDIQVEDRGSVEVGQAVGHLGAQAPSLAVRKEGGPAPAQQGPKTAPLTVLHLYVEQLVLLPGPEVPHDVGVRGQASDGLNLVHVLVPLGLACKGPLALLDGVKPVVGAVAYEPHLAGRGLADAVEELEVVLEAEQLVVNDTAGALQLRRYEYLCVPQ